MMIPQREFFGFWLRQACGQYPASVSRTHLCFSLADLSEKKKEIKKQYKLQYAAIVRCNHRQDLLDDVLTNRGNKSVFPRLGCLWLIWPMASHAGDRGREIVKSAWQIIAFARSSWHFAFQWCFIKT